MSTFRLANEAWNVYYRAQATIAREFVESDIWGEMLDNEYAVLYALSGKPDGLRITQLKDDVLLTQPGMSRLIARLEARGLVLRRDDHADARAQRICLTPAGKEVQQQVGREHARQIARVMGRALTAEQLTALRDISLILLESVNAARQNGNNERSDTE